MNGPLLNARQRVGNAMDSMRANAVATQTIPKSGREKNVPVSLPFPVRVVPKSSAPKNGQKPESKPAPNTARPAASDKRNGRQMDTTERKNCALTKRLLDENKALTEKLAALGPARAGGAEQLTRANADLTRTNAELAQTNAELARTNAELAKASAELMRAKDDLARVREELVKTKADAASVSRSAWNALERTPPMTPVLSSKNSSGAPAAMLSTLADLDALLPRAPESKRPATASVAMPGMHGGPPLSSLEHVEALLGVPSLSRRPDNVASVPFLVLDDL
ncbi:MAG: hypothetical protein KGL39_01535 [Patescibacteria group bacterium]|nr:hypothetical protein [Patescibacteria group bacterium]